MNDFEELLFKLLPNLKGSVLEQTDSAFTYNMLSLHTNGNRYLHIMTPHV